MVSPALEMRSALGGRDVSVCPRSVMLPCPGLPVQAACAAHVVLRTSAFVTAARGKCTSGKSSAQGLARVTLIVAAGVAPTSAFVASPSEPSGAQRLAGNLGGIFRNALASSAFSYSRCSRLFSNGKNGDFRLYQVKGVSARVFVSSDRYSAVVVLKWFLLRDIRKTSAR